MYNICDDIKPIDTEENFFSKELDILTKNKKFFSSNKKYIDEMLDIINSRSNISIRVLDWFVANYSKTYNTCYKIKINGKEDYFYVHNEYKNQLNGCSKLYFDPFCRKRKIIYNYKYIDSDNKKQNIIFISSIGQLNFFKWAIRNKVIKHVQLHLKEIESDMKETYKRNKENKLSSLTNKTSIKKDEIIINEKPDPIICSSDKINNVIISPNKKINNIKDTKNKRQQLSKSVYELGIQKSSISVNLDFD